MVWPSHWVVDVFALRFLRKAAEQEMIHDIYTILLVLYDTISEKFLLDSNAQ